MKLKSLSLIIAVLVVSACTVDSTNYIYKPNTPVTISQKETDIFECEVAASRAVPQDIRISTTPTWTTPVTCNTFGGTTSCMGGQTFGGHVKSSDANERLRSEYVRRCEAQRGYVVTQTPIPACRQDQIPEGFAATSRTLVHTPVEGACYYTSGTTINGHLILLPEDQATSG